MKSTSYIKFLLFAFIFFNTQIFFAQSQIRLIVDKNLQKPSELEVQKVVTIAKAKAMAECPQLAKKIKEVEFTLQHWERVFLILVKFEEEISENKDAIYFLEKIEFGIKNQNIQNDIIQIPYLKILEENQFTATGTIKVEKLYQLASSTCFYNQPLNLSYDKTLKTLKAIESFNFFSRPPWVIKENRQQQASVTTLIHPIDKQYSPENLPPLTKNLLSKLFQNKTTIKFDESNKIFTIFSYFDYHNWVEANFIIEEDGLFFYGTSFGTM